MKIGKHNISKFDSFIYQIVTSYKKSKLKTGDLVYLKHDKTDSNLGIVICECEKYIDLITNALGGAKDINFNSDDSIILFLYRSDLRFGHLKFSNYKENLLYSSDRNTYDITHVVISNPNLNKIFNNVQSLTNYILDSWNQLNDKFE